MKTRIKKAPVVLIFLITISLIFAACSSYKGGKIKDGVYTNDIYGFKITPDSDMSITSSPSFTALIAATLPYFSV